MFSGNSAPLLAINSSDIIVLPNTADYKDVESELDYEGGNEKAAAIINFTYNGSYVGSASVEIVQDTPAVSKTGDSAKPPWGRFIILI